MPAILKKGLKPTDYYISRGEKPVLWFSSNPIWENTVFCADAPTLEEAYQRMNGEVLFRIGCDESVAPHTWKEIKEIANIPFKVATGLYRAAIMVKARPGEWRGTLDVVPLSHFETIEYYDGVCKQWVPIGELETDDGDNNVVWRNPASFE